MAEIDYAQKARDALRLLVKYGGPVTLREVRPGQYDPSTGTVVDEVIDWPAMGVKTHYRLEDIDGTLIQRTDEELYLVAPGLPRPTTGHKLLVGPKEYHVISVQALEPYDTPVLFVLQLRR